MAVQSAMSLVAIRMPFRVLLNLKLPLVTALTSAWNFNRLMVVVRILGGGLSGYLPVVCCWVGGSDSVPFPVDASSSISIVLRGAK